MVVCRQNMRFMDLPKDIIFNILLRFSVRLLLQFKCVCKDWCLIIESCIFKDKYLALRRAKPVDDQVVGLKLNFNAGGIHRSFVTDWYEDYESLLALSAASAPSSNDFIEILSGNSRPFRSFITGHVNGIVCVKGGIRGNGWMDDVRENWFDITLVNPALREFRKLPVPDLGDLGGEDYQCHVMNIGFGYDDATNDYKVFVAVDVADLGYEKIGLVYRLSTDSWRVLGKISDFVFHNHFTPKGEFLLSMSGEALLAHGSIHCIMRSDPNSRVLAFNLTTESFQEMLYPRGWSYDDNKIGSCLLTIDKSTIAVSAFTFKQIDIWVMKEYGDTESWTKLYSINSLPMFHSLLTFWRKDKLLLKTFDKRLICYDIITGQVHEYRLGGSYDVSGGRQEDESPGKCDASCGQPLRWDLEFVSGHESFVSLKQVY